MSMPKDILARFHPLHGLDTLSDAAAELSAKQSEIAGKADAAVVKLESKIARVRDEAAKDAATLQQKHDAALAERDRRCARACHEAIADALATAYEADYRRSALQELMGVYQTYNGEALRITGRDLTEALVLAQAMADLIARRDSSVAPLLATSEFWRQSFPTVSYPLGTAPVNAHAALLGKDPLAARDALEGLERVIVGRAGSFTAALPEDVRPGVRAALRSSLSWDRISDAIEAARAPERERQRQETEIGEAVRQEYRRRQQAEAARHPYPRADYAQWADDQQGRHALGAQGLIDRIRQNPLMPFGE